MVLTKLSSAHLHKIVFTYLKKKYLFPSHQQLYLNIIIFNIIF